MNSHFQSSATTCTSSGLVPRAGRAASMRERTVGIERVV
jgi:hypothetical protein